MHTSISLHFTMHCIMKRIVSVYYVCNVIYNISECLIFSVRLYRRQIKQELILYLGIFSFHIIIIILFCYIVLTIINGTSSNPRTKI